MKQIFALFQRLKIQTKLVVYYAIFIVIMMGIMIFFAYNQTLNSLQGTIDREIALILARQIALEISIMGLPIAILLIAAVRVMAQRITAPLRVLGEMVSHVSDGEFTTAAV